MEVALGESFSEAMDTDSKVCSVDANLSGPDEVAVGTRLLDATSMGAKDTIVDECRRSEALTSSQEPTPTELPGSQGLIESRNELLQRVQALKKDLENWRGKLDTQVKSYRKELGGLRSTLNSEVDQLRVGFQDLRNILKHQQELTATNLANLDEPKETVIHSKFPLQDAELDTNLTA